MILRGVTKKYGETVALNAIDLALEEGKIAAVLGESGAGKSTLLGVLAGTLPFEGEREGGGRVSYLFQDPKLLPNLTVEGNLRFVLPKPMWGGIGGMLARVGLAGKEKRLPRSLSGGERQRVAIARAFLYPHETLLMDEPFSSLDLALKHSLVGLVASLWRERGETIVFVTHDVHEAAVLAHRVIVLKRGEIAADLSAEGDPPRDFFARPPLEDDLIRILAQPKP